MHDWWWWWLPSLRPRSWCLSSSPPTRSVPLAVAGLSSTLSRDSLFLVSLLTGALLGTRIAQRPLNEVECRRSVDRRLFHGRSDGTQRVEAGRASTCRVVIVWSCLQVWESLSEGKDAKTIRMQCLVLKKKTSSISQGGSPT